MLDNEREDQKRASLRKWSGTRCPTTFDAQKTLQKYDLKPVARFEINNAGQFSIMPTDPTAGDLEQAIYAFVIEK
jgi:hypothetical protein